MYNNISVLENSAIDNINNIQLNNVLKKKICKIQLMIFYQYYIYNNKMRVTVLSNNNQEIKSNSLDKIFKSLNWLERETSEMFKITFNNKTDVRRLLLDYTKNDNPMLKDFPSEGYTDVYYCFFNDQVVFSTNNTTEL